MSSHRWLVMEGWALLASNRSDFAAVRALLSDAGPPTEELASAPGLQFWVAEQGSWTVGAVGLEPHGLAGLLRSVAVAASYSAHGLGSARVLLTQTAEPFCKRLRHSAEFASLCPSSAVCMTKIVAERQPTGPHE